jgi:hypothetical protein
MEGACGEEEQETLHGECEIAPSNGMKHCIPVTEARIISSHSQQCACLYEDAYSHSRFTAHMGASSGSCSTRLL